MVAVQVDMFSSEGKAETPGVGCSIRSMSSFWSLAGVLVCVPEGMVIVVGERAKGGPLRNGCVGVGAAAVG
jgi:hypothetical protein